MRSVSPALASLAVVNVLSLAACATPQADAGGGTERAVALTERWPAVPDAGLIDPQVEAEVETLLAALSVEEKVGQVIQADIGSITPEDLRRYPLGSVLAGGNSGPGGDDRAPAAAWLDLAQRFHAVSTEKRPGRTPVPVLFGVDAVHGHNNIRGATLFPHNIGLGAARDPDLIRRIGEITARELSATGVDWTFAPTVAVARNDRWGRTYESYAEDPAVVAAYSRAVVEGLQGPKGGDEGLQPGKTVSAAKHFLADGGTQDGRDQGDAVISEQELVEIHNAGYPPAIEAGVLTVMASFSSWNGQKVTGNRSLLTDVLKDRMGFDGFVVSDWNAHGQVPGCTNESCAAAFNAGIDMFMAPDSWKGLYDNTLAQVRSGEIPMARLDDAVRRILRVKFKAGLMRAGPPASRPGAGRYELLGAPEHRAVAREAVRKSLVLLKNEKGLLPLAPRSRVLVAGDGADDFAKQAGGWTITWQGTDVRRADVPNGQTVWDGVREAVTAGGGAAELSVDGSFRTRPDVAIVVFGEEPYAEFQGDRANVDFSPTGPLETLKRLRAQGVPTVAVFFSGRPLWVNPEINASDAFVAAFLPGSEGGGVADVLFRSADGRVRHDFAGRLSFSWPARADQDRLNGGDPGYAPLFPFGHGQSYARPQTVARLSEISGLSPNAASSTVFFANGRSPAPWSLALRDPSGATNETSGAARSPADAVRSSPADAGAQENARALRWSGGREGAVLARGAVVDLRQEADRGSVLTVRVRVDQAPTGSFRLGMNAGSVEIGPILRSQPTSEFRTVSVALSCFAAAGADLSRIDEPLVLSTANAAALTVTDMRVAPGTASAPCPS